MILTCPSCGTQYVVKDGAIPPQGRQVRCASCKHSWHQDPEVQAVAEEEADTLPEEAVIEPRSGPDAEERAYIASEMAAEEEQGAEEPAATAAGFAPVEQPEQWEQPEQPEQPAQEPERDAYTPPSSEQPSEPAPAADDDFSPFALRERIEARRRPPAVSLLLILLVVALLAAAFWFLAPAEWKQRLGLAGAGETPLQLMMTHSDRQKLASGNELLAVSGRVINPTEESQPVPPIQAELRSSSGEVVYSWTIAPPARNLAPGASASFNSAEINVPPGGDELTITLGSGEPS